MLDYPRNKSIDKEIETQNAQLMEKYSKEVEYFPTILVLDPKEKIVGKLGPAANATSFIENVESVLN